MCEKWRYAVNPRLSASTTCSSNASISNGEKHPSYSKGVTKRCHKPHETWSGPVLILLSVQGSPLLSSEASILGRIQGSGSPRCPRLLTHECVPTIIAWCRKRRSYSVHWLNIRNGESYENLWEGHDSGNDEWIRGHWAPSLFPAKFVILWLNPLSILSKTTRWHHI